MTYMIKAILTQTISVSGRSRDEPVNRRNARSWRFIVGKETELPFVPIEGMAFCDGDDDDEIQATDVHWNLQKQRFDICCGGMLCEDDDQAMQSLNYELSKGWVLLEQRDSDNGNGQDDE